ncbi:MAG: T9SS type A sorting domain-containing protein [Bacteroidia bacterium]|nr:T9SS type A sorting domain-containing protein [Bacteroidia bacterium]
MKTNHLLTLCIGILLCSSFPIHAQTIVQDNIVLDKPLGNSSYEYMGIQTITLKPGFSYKAVLPNTFRAFIPQRMKYTYDLAGNRISRTIVLTTVRSATIESQNRIDSLPKNDETIMTMSPPQVEENIKEELKLKIYPNPVKSILNIELSNFEFATVGEIIIADLSGRIVIQQKIEGQLTPINMSSLLKGYYILRIVIAQQVSTWKIIKE